LGQCRTDTYDRYKTAYQCYFFNHFSPTLV
jgi:hypothetical protein